jgi:hypothetical protein
VAEFQLSSGANAAFTSADEVAVPSQAFPSQNAISALAQSTIDAGMAISPGTAAAGNQAVKCSAASGSTTQNCIGLATTFTPEGDYCPVQYTGPLTLTIAQWNQIAGTTEGLVTGDVYYVSAGPAFAGFLTSTAPTATGTYQVAVGIAISPTTMMIGQHLPVGPHA